MVIYHFLKEIIKKEKIILEKEFNAYEMMGNSYQLERERVKAVADEVFVFCPSVDMGIKLVDQSPKDNSHELTDVHILSSKETAVNWDETINGIRMNSLPVDNKFGFLINSVIVRSYEGSSYCAKTIIVSEEIFMDLLNQIERSLIDKNDRKDYKELFIHSRIINLLNKDVNDKLKEYYSTETDDYRRKK